LETAQQLNLTIDSPQMSAICFLLGLLPGASGSPYDRAAQFTSAILTTPAGPGSMGLKTGYRLPPGLPQLLFIVIIVMLALIFERFVAENPSGFRSTRLSLASLEPSCYSANWWTRESPAVRVPLSTRRRPSGEISTEEMA